MISDDEALELFERCSNAGRWGADDDLGTLNLITPEVRRRAASLVRSGVSISLAEDVGLRQTSQNPQPARHIMHLELTHPDATADSVLLDDAAARGVGWLASDHVVTPDDLESAERAAGLRVEPGDAIFVHTGLARRLSASTTDATARAGLGVPAVEWLHDRDVAVYSGDCVESLPGRDPALPLPLHQLGIAAMGLVLLDWPSLRPLVAACATHDRSEFLLTAAPLSIPGATGSPINPIATF